MPAVPKSSNESDQLSSSASQSLWEIINKPIVIWFMSSVVLAAISFSYSALNARLRAAEQIQRQVDMLQTQAAIRMELAEQIAIALAEVWGGMKPYEKRRRLLTIIDELLYGSNNSQMFPEYKETATLALIYSLNRLRPVPEDNMKHVAARILELILLRMSLNETNSAEELDQIKDKVTTLADELLDP